MKSNTKRHFEEVLDTFAAGTTTANRALNQAGTYCAQIILREQAGDERISRELLNAIPILRMQVATRQKDGAEMCIAASTAIAEYMATHPNRERGWFAEAARQGKNAARKVFKAGFFSPDDAEPDPYIPPEVWAAKRMLAGKPAPKLRDEEWAYRTRHEGKFYVNDPIVPAGISSISVAISEPEKVQERTPDEQMFAIANAALSAVADKPATEYGEIAHHFEVMVYNRDYVGVLRRASELMLITADTRFIRVCRKAQVAVQTEYSRHGKKSAKKLRDQLNKLIAEQHYTLAIEIAMTI